MRKIWIFSILMIMLFMMSGCSQKAKPIAIDEKNDKCDTCHMEVGNNSFATELVLKNGKTLKFDDIGCMYAWVNEHKKEKINTMFVRDYKTSAWLEADSATYVYDKNIHTPMAYNVISFQDEKAAKRFIQNNGGTLLTYDQLAHHTWERNKEMMMKMKHKKMKHGKKEMNKHDNHMGN
ncbi:nitrous oxide reductase accessory protein NosL [Geobacillus icigianus]|uniref:Lipoprotein n=1 Tax=Geobacillus subterraneus TaxID=129338 RepID=A0A679FJM8_9BACL|nr:MULTISPECIES: nitrous oxide reductase accessory protein NosL [Geobacillus]KYD28986.1 hypothetical protein B4113_2700 [Geobacillus sp. B4113_201601]BBW96438.1 hypothetical protein GsuE55_12710 [Geobacillus subterraneus]